MALYDRTAVPCVFMIANRTADGSGGFNTEWAEGEQFFAAVVRDSSTEARIAEATGTVEMYTVTVSRSVHLPYHAVFKRLTDGKTFRTTSDSAEKIAPAFSALDIAQATAEAWGLTV